MKRNKPEYDIDFDYKAYIKDSINTVARRIGGFVETIQEGGIKTFTVDFRLAGGFFYGWTLWDMTGAGEEALNSLKWILEKDFPEEVKSCIMRHLEDRGLTGDKRNARRERRY